VTNTASLHLQNDLVGLRLRHGRLLHDECLAEANELGGPHCRSAPLAGRFDSPPPKFPKNGRRNGTAGTRSRVCLMPLHPLLQSGVLWHRVPMMPGRIHLTHGLSSSDGRTTPGIISPSAVVSNPDLFLTPQSNWVVSNPMCCKVDPSAPAVVCQRECGRDLPTTS
jgi:hypothetical protein